MVHPSLFGCVFYILRHPDGVYRGTPAAGSVGYPVLRLDRWLTAAKPGGLQLPSTSDGESCMLASTPGAGGGACTEIHVLYIHTAFCYHWPALVRQHLQWQRARLLLGQEQVACLHHSSVLSQSSEPVTSSALKAFVKQLRGCLPWLSRFLPPARIRPLAYLKRSEVKGEPCLACLKRRGSPALHT